MNRVLSLAIDLSWRRPVHAGEGGADGLVRCRHDPRPAKEPSRATCIATGCPAATSTFRSTEWPLSPASPSAAGSPSSRWGTKR